MIPLTLSFAQSLDGSIATKTNDSKWISCHESLVFAHELRRSHDAIMVGRGTVEIDDPLLNSRLAGPVEQQPSRIILDSHLSLEAHYQVFKTAKIQKTIVFTLEESRSKLDRISLLAELGVQIEFIKASYLKLELVMARLEDLGIKSLFVEGGSRLISSIVKESLWTKIYLIVAPLFIGGKPALNDLGFTLLSEIPRYEISSHRLIGRDLCIEINKSA